MSGHLLLEDALLLALRAHCADCGALLMPCQSALVCVGCMECSDSVAHATAAVCNVKKRTNLTSFFK